MFAFKNIDINCNYNGVTFGQHERMDAMTSYAKANIAVKL